MSETSKRGSLWRLVNCHSGSARDRRNQHILVGWAGAWGLSLIAATWLLKSDYDFSFAVQTAIALVPAVMAVVSMLVYLRYLRMADELLRKIQFEGLAFGFGVGIIIGLVYPTFELVGAPVLDLNTLVAIMMFAWAFGQIFGARRYL